MTVRVGILGCYCAEYRGIPAGRAFKQTVIGAIMVDDSGLLIKFVWFSPQNAG